MEGKLTYCLERQSHGAGQGGLTAREAAQVLCAPADARQRDAVGRTAIQGERG